MGSSGVLKRINHKQSRCLSVAETSKTRSHPIHCSINEGHERATHMHPTKKQNNFPHNTPHTKRNSQVHSHTRTHILPRPHAHPHPHSHPHSRTFTHARPHINTCTPSHQHMHTTPTSKPVKVHPHHHTHIHTRIRTPGYPRPSMCASNAHTHTYTDRERERHEKKREWSSGKEQGKKERAQSRILLLWNLEIVRTPAQIVRVESVFELLPMVQISLSTSDYQLQVAKLGYVLLPGFLRPRPLFGTERVRDIQRIDVTAWTLVMRNLTKRGEEEIAITRNACTNSVTPTQKKKTKTHTTHNTDSVSLN